MKTTIAQEIYAGLAQKSDPKQREILMRFFKTGKGGYGEGDQFLGLTVPAIREEVKKNLSIPLDVIGELLQSPWHEVRHCALLILAEQFKKSKAEEQREAIYRYYLSQTDRINNWDLVDVSCYKIVGAYLLHHNNDDDLFRLAQSSNMWEQRIAIVSTMAFIRKGHTKTTLQLAELLLHHSHDLMHKATGWMLREVGKKNLQALLSFLDQHAATMPRTTLRYAIEKFPEEQRKYYMELKKKQKL